MEVVQPTVEAVTNVLTACNRQDSKVKRVVYTSSLATIAGDSYEDGRVYSEKDFADVEGSQP